MKKIVIILLMSLGFSCDKKTEPNFSFDMNLWMKDKNACDNFRETHVDEIIALKDEFIGWPERQVNSFFGRPDRHRLSGRHQKFYVYFLENGKQCDPNDGRYGRFLQLRFDATGYVNEVELRTDFEQLRD